MNPWPDHLRCPPLAQWLPAAVESGQPAAWVASPRPRWKPPRILQRWVATWPEWSEDWGGRALVVLRPLGDPDPLPSDLLERLPRTVDLIELATMPSRTLVERLRPSRYRWSAADWAVRRLQWYARHGGADLEQWVSSDPYDVLVTRMRFSRRWALL